MQHGDDILHLIISAQTLSRITSLETRNDAPAAQWRTLNLLRQHGPQRVGDLATLSRVTQPGMTRLVAQMSEAGLLERRPDAHASRVTVVSATDAGLTALDEWFQTLSDALAPRFADLGEDDWATIRRATEIVDARTRVAAEGTTR